jgi:matrixin
VDQSGINRLKPLLTVMTLALALVLPASAHAAKKLRYDEMSSGVQPQFVVVTKWERYNLTYGFVNGTADIPDEQQAVREALKLWTDASGLKLTEVSWPSADIQISWATGDHGDGFPFDGPNGILAHAFYPPNGDMHFDDAEDWTTSIRPNGTQPMDLVTVAAHEFGHAIGLAHSPVPGALMNEYYTGSHRYLSQDDIEAVQSLYPPPKELRLASIRTKSQGNKKTEVHVYSGSSQFSQSLWNVDTPLAEAAPNEWQFSYRDTNNDGWDDLIGIKTMNTASKKVEVHIYSGATSFSTTLWNVVTSIPEAAPDEWQFSYRDTNNDKWDDLIGIKTRNTASKKVEVHIYSGITEFATTVKDVNTVIPEAAPDEWQFSYRDTNKDGWDDLIGIKARNTASKKVEVHIYSGATSFTTTLWDVNTVIPEAAPDEWQFSYRDTNKDGWDDLIGIKTMNTASKDVEVHVYSGASSFTSTLWDVVTPLPEAAADEWQFSYRDTNKDGWDDLVGVKLKNSGTRRNEVHVYGAGSNFNASLWDVVTPLPEAAPNEWQFSYRDTNKDGWDDLIGIKTMNTASKKVEVHIYSGATRFTTSLWDVVTQIPEAAPDEWQFSYCDTNKDGWDDLIGIKTRNNASKKVSVIVYSGANSFVGILRNVTTSISEAAPDEWQFSYRDTNKDGRDDLIGIKTRNTASKKVEVHIYDGAAEFSTTLWNVNTVIPEAAPNEWQFSYMDTNYDEWDDLVGAKLTGTATKKIEVHIYSGASSFTKSLWDVATAMPEATPDERQLSFLY